MMTQLTKLGLLCCIGLAMVGCSSEAERFRLAGTVTLDGQPLDRCLIVFASKDSSALGTTGTVSSGKFEIPKESGATVGKYDIYFTEIQPDLEDFEAARAANQNIIRQTVLPPQFSDRNTLEATVSESKPNEFTFALTSN